MKTFLEYVNGKSDNDILMIDEMLNDEMLITEGVFKDKFFSVLAKIFGKSAQGCLNKIEDQNIKNNVSLTQAYFAKLNDKNATKEITALNDTLAKLDDQEAILKTVKETVQQILDDKKDASYAQALYLQNILEKSEDSEAQELAKKLDEKYKNGDEAKEYEKAKKVISLNYDKIKNKAVRENGDKKILEAIKGASEEITALAKIGGIKPETAASNIYDYLTKNYRKQTESEKDGVKKLSYGWNKDVIKNSLTEEALVKGFVSFITSLVQLQNPSLVKSFISKLNETDCKKKSILQAFGIKKEGDKEENAAEEQQTTTKLNSQGQKNVATN
jgi:hypothetical protein